MSGTGTSQHIEVWPDAEIVLDAVTVEDTTPASAIDAADAGYTNALAVRVRVTVANDGDQIAAVRVSEAPDFAGASWTADFALAGDASEFTAPFTLSDSDGAKTVYVQARDALDAASNVVNGTVTLDRVAPTNPGVSWADGAYTAQVATDILPTCQGAAWMRVESSKSDVSGWAAGNLDEWVAYSADAVEATLAGTVGTKTVTMRFRDEAGNLTPEVSAAIEYSTDGASEPQNLDSDKADDGVWCADATTHTFTWDAPATIGASGIDKYLYTTDGSTPTVGGATTGETADAATRTFTFDPPDESASYQVQVRALMGNGIEGNIASFDLLVDLVAPTAENPTPADGAQTPDNGQIITVTLVDTGGSGIDTSTITLTVDGTPYTLADPGLSYSGGLLTFEPVAQSIALDEGAVPCSVAFDDAAGNSGSLAWSFSVDESGPTFAVAYYSDPGLSSALPVSGLPQAKAGTIWLKITPSEALLASPTFRVTRPGTAEAENFATSAFADGVYRGSYTVETADGALYLDGTASTVVSGIDSNGNAASDGVPTSGASFAIDTVAPTAVLLYSRDRHHLGPGSVTISAVFSEPISQALGTVKLAVADAEGTDVLAPTAMTRLSATAYQYVWTLPALSEGPYTARIEDAYDVAANACVEVADTDLYYDESPPTIYALDVTPLASTVAGWDVVQVAFRTSEPMDVASLAVTVDGESASLSAASHDRTRFVFEYSVQGTETEGTVVVAISGDDQAGQSANASTVCILDFTQPAITITRPSAPDEELTGDPLVCTWDWSDANGILPEYATIQLDGVDVTADCTLAPTGGQYEGS